jgi:hypothetical protein
MSMKITYAAVAVLALAVGIAIVPRGTDIGSAPAPSTSPSPSSSPGPAPLRQGQLFAGAYSVTPFVGDEWAPCGPNEPSCEEAAIDDDIRFTFTVPDGWAGEPFGSGIWLAAGANSAPSGAGFAIGRGGWLFSDPCTSPETDISVGPTVDDFVGALRNHPAALDLGEPLDVTIGGYAGTYMELHGPSAAAYANCPNFQAWSPTFYAQGADNLQHLWVVDVDGVRVVIHGSEFPRTDPNRSAELREIVETMRIDHDPAIAPTPSPRTARSAGEISAWPGARAEPAGLYSWTVGSGSRWMHKVPSGWTEAAPNSVEVTVGIVGDEQDSFAGSLTYAGVDQGGFHDGPTRVLDGPTQRWRLDVDDTQVYVHVRSYPGTDPALVGEAVDVVESITVRPAADGQGRIVVFELPAGWGSG